MAELQGYEVEAMIKAFSTLKYSRFMIKKELEKQSIVINERKISRIIGNVGKKRQAALTGDFSGLCAKPRSARTKENIKKV